MALKDNTATNEPIRSLVCGPVDKKKEQKTFSPSIIPEFVTFQDELSSDTERVNLVSYFLAIATVYALDCFD